MQGLICYRSMCKACSVVVMQRCQRWYESAPGRTRGARKGRYGLELRRRSGRPRRWGDAWGQRMWGWWSAMGGVWKATMTEGGGRGEKVSRKGARRDRGRGQPSRIGGRGERGGRREGAGAGGRGPGG